MKPTTIAIIFILLIAIVGVGLAEDLQWTEVTSSANWSERAYHATAVFDNKLWVVGGLNASGYQNDVWSSIDGVIWNCTNSSPPFLPRGGHSLLTNGTYLFVIGGTNNSATSYNAITYVSMHDVWMSSDGVFWSLATNSPSWMTTENGTNVGLAYFGSNDNSGTLNIVGGYKGYSNSPSASYYQDLVSKYMYSSTDGITWTNVGTLPVGPTISGGGYTYFEQWYGIQSPWMSSTVIGGKSIRGLASGGYYMYPYFPDYGTVYSTYSGTPWTTRTTTSSWTPRIYHSAVYFNSKLILMGGLSSDSLYKHDVWYSSDEGTTWNQYSDANWSIRQHPQAQVFDSKIYVIGGYSSAEGYHNDVWSGVINSSATTPGTSTLTGMGSMYAPHTVKFLVKDRYGNGIPGLTVVATSQETTLGSWDWLKSLFGINTETNIAGSTMTGTSGADGAISFVMMESIGYNLTFTNTTSGISYQALIYPQESEILINIKDYPNITHPKSDYISYNITEYQNANNSITLRGYYSDTLNSTTNSTFWVKFSNDTFIYSDPKVPNTNSSFIYLLPYTQNVTYYYGIIATSSVYGTTNQTKVYSFPTFVDLEIPTVYYSWISAAILLLFCAIFSRGNNIFGVIIIPAVASFLVYIGWLPITMGVIATSLLVLGVLLYMKARSVE